MILTLDQIALITTLLVPLALLHAHALAEILIGITDILFLVRCARQRSWFWLRAGWMPFGLAWWIWEVLVSVPVAPLGNGGIPSLIQAIVTIRFFIFVAALEHQVLRSASARRWMYRVVAFDALYIGLQSLLQYGTGHNLYGAPRHGDGELTGPFFKPRAGPPFSRILFPAVLPPVMAWLRRPDWAHRIGAVVLAVGAIATIVLIGQRMPVLLTGLGLVVCALLLPRLRWVLIAGAVAGAVVIAASPVISPPTYYRLVEKFSHQMDHFRSSPYGQIYTRALIIAEAHPWTGRGYDGFRTGCKEPRYFHNLAWALGRTGGPDPTGGGAAICVQHPHNFFLTAVTDGGVPGLILFSVLVLAWLGQLFQGLWRAPDPLRVGLFVAALIHLWPIASTSALFSMPMSGYFYVLLGWGLAELRHRPTPALGHPAPSTPYPAS